MTKQEAFLLNKIFDPKASRNYLREWTLLEIIHRIMSLKNETDETKIDMLGLLNSIKSLTDSGHITKRSGPVKDFWGQKKEEIFLCFTHRTV